MKTIKEEITNEITINKSRFITVLSPIDNPEQIEEKLDKIKKIYKDATHYCYAYIIDSKEKCSDDKEPSGTAGLPILNILKINDLTNIICIVIRYFGGIKLGAGGLIRAYSNSANEIVKKANIGNIIKGYEITIDLNYSNIKDIDYLLKKYRPEKNFGNTITYSFKIPTEDYKKIKNNLNALAHITETKEINMTKGEN